MDNDNVGNMIVRFSFLPRLISFLKEYVLRAGKSSRNRRNVTQEIGMATKTAYIKNGSGHTWRHDERSLIAFWGFDSSRA